MLEEGIQGVESLIDIAAATKTRDNIKKKLQRKSIKQQIKDRTQIISAEVKRKKLY